MDEVAKLFSNSYFTLSSRHFGSRGTRSASRGNTPPFPSSKQDMTAPRARTRSAKRQRPSRLGKPARIRETANSKPQGRGSPRAA